MLDPIERAIAEGSEVLQKIHTQEEDIQLGNKNLESVVNKMVFRTSENVTHHLTKIINDKDDKIKLLQENLDKCHTAVLENELLKGKINQLENKIADLKGKINQFDYSKVIARKVENDK